MFLLFKNICIFLRDNSSDPLSGDPDAAEWEKGFIEYAIENVSPIVKSKAQKVLHLFTAT